MRDLGLISLLFFNKPQLSPAVGDQSREYLAEVLVEPHKVFLKCLLLLLIHINQQLHDSFLSNYLFSKLLHQLLVFGGVLVIPLDTVSVLSRHLIKLHSFFLYFTGELLDSFVLS